MSTFYSSDPQGLMLEYGDKFYDVIDKIFETKHRDYAQEFIFYLIPIKLGRVEDVAKLEKIYNQAHEDRTHFRKLIKMNIEDLQDIIAKRQ